jgi:hypothetical protein
VTYDPTACDSWSFIGCCNIVGASPAITGAAVEAATDILWAASGRQFGVCPIVLRPCRRECAVAASSNWLEYGSSSWQWPFPALIDGAWVNLACGSCHGGCSCSAVEEVILPHPVANIVEIRVDGQVIPTGSYRVDDFRVLVREDGERWPLCQDLTKPAGAVGTWTITVNVGSPVPTLGELAMGELICEIVAARDDSSECRLPRQVAELVRQGVRITLTDLSKLLDKGRLGLEFCDLFIQTYNPNGIKQEAQVYSIDVPYPRTTTS